MNATVRMTKANPLGNLSFGSDFSENFRGLIMHADYSNRAGSAEDLRSRVWVGLDR